MNVAKKIEPVTPEEFEAMEKSDHFSYELIDGIVMMSPSPSFKHQLISGNLYHELKTILKGGKCLPIQDFDLILDKHPFKPDLMVICTNFDTLLDAKYYTEPPTIAIEIISPSSASRDHITKRYLYEQLGILEYWIVSPEESCITIMDFVNNQHEMYNTGCAKSFVLPDIHLDLANIFD